VRVSEAIRILQAIAEQPIYADVIDPDKHKREKSTRMEHERGQKQRKGCNVGVNCVIASRTPAWTG